MEDGENGAKRIWNGYIQEKSSIYFEKIDETHEKVLELGREKKNGAPISALSMIF